MHARLQELWPLINSMHTNIIWKYTLTCPDYIVICIMTTCNLWEKKHLFIHEYRDSNVGEINLCYSGINIEPFILKTYTNLAVNIADTASAGGILGDFEMLDEMLMFSIGETVMCTNITINQDSNLEQIEFFQVTATYANGEEIVDSPSFISISSGDSKLS